MTIEAFSPGAAEGAHRAPTNGARVGVTRVGRRYAPSNPRSSEHRANRARAATPHSSR